MPFTRCDKKNVVYFLFNDFCWRWMENMRANVTRCKHNCMTTKTNMKAVAFNFSSGHGKSYTNNVICVRHTILVSITLILYRGNIFTLNFVSFCFVNLQALCGVVFEVPTLGGDKLRISTMQEVIKPNTVKRITGYGLPLPKDPSRKGDMLVAFDIKFPDKLTASEKELLNDVLPSA